MLSPPQHVRPGWHEYKHSFNSKDKSKAHKDINLNIQDYLFYKETEQCLQKSMYLRLWYSYEHSQYVIWGVLECRFWNYNYNFAGAKTDQTMAVWSVLLSVETQITKSKTPRKTGSHFQRIYLSPYESYHRSQYFIWNFCVCRLRNSKHIFVVINIFWAIDI